jgi:hypothetical protein
MEVVLIVLEDVEDSLHSAIPLESEAQLAVAFEGSRFLRDEEKGLHIPEIITRARSVFLVFMSETGVY